MKIISLLLVILVAVVACNSTLPITANPDHSAYTSGTAGSAKSSDGPLHEGPKTVIDSSKMIRDSTRKQ